MCVLTKPLLNFTNQICEFVFFRSSTQLRYPLIHESNRIKNLQKGKGYKSAKISNLLQLQILQQLRPTYSFVQPQYRIKSKPASSSSSTSATSFDLSFLEATLPQHGHFSFLLLSSSGNWKV